jgi:acyl-CoA thioesterase II
VLELHHHGDGRYTFELTPELARFDDKLFGGAGLAAAVAAFEAETRRRAIWATVQFVGSADLGERIECRAEVLAAGHNTSQVEVTATVGERLVFKALGSTARDRENGFSYELGSIPDVPGPDESEGWLPEFPFPIDTVAARGPFSTAEFRLAKRDDGRTGLWVRLPSVPQTRTTVAYLADFVPSSVLRAAGRAGGGTSLDNSIRFGREPARGTDWILIETDPWIIDGGYVHGGARIWAADGTLLAVASQTAVARLFD